MSFCPGTERWDRTPDTEMPFCPRPRRFVPGQKGGTERPGIEALIVAEYYIYISIIRRLATLETRSPGE